MNEPLLSRIKGAMIKRKTRFTATIVRKKKLQRKMTEDYNWISAETNIGMFSNL